MANINNSPITQVSQHHVPTHSNLQPQLLTRLFLDLRGRRFEVDRDTIMNLPESVLLCLFPNGLVLAGREDEEVYGVDFDPDCFQFVLNFFRTASEATSSTPQADFGPTSSQNPLLSKQAIIVLREELEYFSIPPNDGQPLTDQNGIANDKLLDIKRRTYLPALQRNVNKENNVAEQHLIDMLCMSGFDREDEWGFRALEPSRCCISSIALVLLKTGIQHFADAEKQAEIDYSQMATAQKLLLFWRKPARKCWWDGMDVDLPATDSAPAATIKLWARRVLDPGTAAWWVSLCNPSQPA
ncbi:hypothetical protein FA13DRAFT_1754470 [Coprinellus micaceus]|uniref:Potassium channel tetramerisation-type BTB domain-containing protein n=1 Tax=Coprinellus micaceus TaxID=71717 RepID=A0A4Y7TEI5_COPMI|nr:hypothetical protein FA13DRAFT_1754470 [Coprinellus micaceus]